MGFTFAPYRFVIANERFWTAFGVTLRRLVIGVAAEPVPCGYDGVPLSKDERNSRAQGLRLVLHHRDDLPRRAGADLLLVQNLGLIDTVWALVLPGGMNVFNAVILMNFFRAFRARSRNPPLLDGAGQFRILAQLFLPLSLPSLATITLFSFMNHWNAWMDGRI
jgi:putative aldouronate transport system permease protein